MDGHSWEQGCTCFLVRISQPPKTIDQSVSQSVSQLGYVSRYRNCAATSQPASGEALGGSSSWASLP
jgi:hypothetical protein